MEEKHHEVYVRASGATVPYDHYCEIDVEFWLKPKWNTVRKENLRWTRGVSESPGPPDHGWKVWGGVIMVFNDDATRSFAISGFEYHISIAYWPDLKAVPYDVSIPGDFTLLPREKKTFAAPVGDLTEGHTYFHFRMLDAPGGNVLSEEWADHEVFPYSVGGVWVTVDKLGLLAPYIGLASTIIVATVATAIYVKRVKRRNEK